MLVDSFIANADFNQSSITIKKFNYFRCLEFAQLCSGEFIIMISNLNPRRTTINLKVENSDFALCSIDSVIIQKDCAIFIENKLLLLNLFKPLHCFWFLVEFLVVRFLFNLFHSYFHCLFVLDCKCFKKHFKLPKQIKFEINAVARLLITKMGELS